MNIKQILKATNGKHINGDINTNISNYCFDSRKLNKNDFYLPIFNDIIDAHKYILDIVKSGAIGFIYSKDNSKKVAEAILLNKNLCVIEVDNVKEALINMASFNRSLNTKTKVIGITGSVGKTSTREMIYSVLSTHFDCLKTDENFNGDIGLPFTLLSLTDQDVAIIEHGIDYIGEMDKLVEVSKPNISVVTNISTSHIENFGSKENIYKEKIKITKYSDVSFLNKDDEILSTCNLNNIKYFSKEDIKDLNINENKTEYTTKIYNKDVKITINALGYHNIYNSLVSIKIAEYLKIPVDKILFGIANYKNFDRRFEVIQKNNYTIIDDAYNSNLDSIISGITTISRMKAKRKIIVLGDILVQGEFSKETHTKVGEFLKNYTKIHKFDILITIGEYTKDISKLVMDNFKTLIHCSSNDEIYNYLESIVSNDDIIYFKASNGFNFKEIIEKLKKR